MYYSETYAPYWYCRTYHRYAFQMLTPLLPESIICRIKMGFLLGDITGESVQIVKEA